MTGYAKVLCEAVTETDAIARHYYGKRDIQVLQKHDLSPVTAADQEIERTLTRFFRAQWPHVAILGEEYGVTSSAGDAHHPRLRVIIDPIDGTRNFVRGIPIFGTLLAVSFEDEIVAGVVSNPIQREHWVAEKSQGATYNGVPISVSRIATMAEAQAFHGGLYGSESLYLPREKVLDLLSQTHRQRAFGDFYGHVLIASGAGEFSLDFGLQPWDKAPFKIIVEEAGGRVTNLDGSFSLEDGSLVCSNGWLHDEVLAALQ